MRRSIRVDSPELLRTNIAPLLFSEHFSDVTFVIEATGERISAHRQLLASASSVFAKMLYGPFVEGSSREVKLSEISASTARSLLEYIYTGHVEISFSDIVPLMSAADLFCINSAKEDFLDAAKAVIDAADCSEASINQILTTLSEAATAGLSDLCSECLDFVDLNSQEVLESKAFLAVAFPLAADILARDTLCDTLEEMQVLLAALRWARGWGDLNVEDSSNFSLPVLEEEKMQELRALAETVRLPLIPGRDIVEFVGPLGIYAHDKLYRALSYQVAPDLEKSGDSAFFRDRVGSFRPWTWSEDLIGPHMALGNEFRTAVAHHYDWEKVVGAVEWHSGVHQFACVVEMNVGGSSNSWLVIVGVTSPAAQPSGHLGAGPKEWGFACYSGIKISSSDRREEYAKPCKSGDVVTTVVDLRKKTLEFLINGVSQGVAFTEVSSPLRPAVSLLRGQRVTLKFDD